MKAMTDTEKAHILLRAVENDLRMFLQDGEGVDPTEYFENVHIAVIEAMTLLGIDDDDENEAVLEAMLAEQEEREHAAELENFDPITHIEAQEKLTKTI